ncbi:response regulator transcription factor [Actinocatenispora rupis]|uniref:Transcriptional regulator n=1 Tax=Actinocatenispora rupis TaxID=519421 RepID=A0A8J3J2J7_9ACTN|nr:response regulator transcription factor [Actinocatenispora rupis]GID10817.1 transcriptional regulator [Actinocatenispora rupis]
MTPIRVLVVDDQPLFAEALSAWLARDPGFEVVAAAQNGAGARDALAATAVDVVLVDLDLGDESGIDLLDHVRDHHPGTRAVVLTASNSPDALADAVRRGAASWLSKTADGATLTRVLRGVLRDEVWIPPNLLGGLLRTLTEQPGSTVLDRLTVRERQILQCLVDGLTRAEIADRLFLSANTVRTHTQNLLAKLSVHSVLEAVALALRHGMRPSGPAGTD